MATKAGERWQLKAQLTLLLDEQFTTHI